MARASCPTACRASPAKYLKEYYSTLEEARADLMGLWNISDPKLKALGLVKEQDEVAKAMFDSAARAPLTQLRPSPARRETPSGSISNTLGCTTSLAIR